MLSKFTYIYIYIYNKNISAEVSLVTGTKERALVGVGVRVVVGSCCVGVGTEWRGDGGRGSELAAVIVPCDWQELKWPTLLW